MPSLHRCSLFLALALICAAAPASAQSRAFDVGRGSRIVFTSDAPLETITGRSAEVMGTFTLDPNDLSRVRGTIRVPIASLRTGVALRDEHLRGDGWLDAERFPHATFEITRFEGAARLEPNRPARLRIHGRFTLHGVTRPIVATARVRLLPGEQPRIEAEARFSLQLTDFGVSVPLPVRLKVANEIQVEVTLRALSSSSR